MDELLMNLQDAEDFFHFYQVPYDKKILAVARLHILKRFNQYLLQEDLLHGDSRDPNVWEKQRLLFVKSYEDFVHSTPLKEKVFPVFHQNTETFVPIASFKRRK